MLANLSSGGASLINGGFVSVSSQWVSKGESVVIGVCMGFSSKEISSGDSGVGVVGVCLVGGGECMGGCVMGWVFLLIRDEVSLMKSISSMVGYQLMVSFVKKKFGAFLSK